MQSLSELIHSSPLLDLPRSSRVHRLHSFQFPHACCYVKREDELNFGMSGSKLRKYLSLMPHVLSMKPQEAVVLGASQSNHVLSISQLLRQHQIEPIYFLLGTPSLPLVGNALFLSLFAQEDHIHWVPRRGWNQLDQLAIDYQAQQKNKGISVAIIPKGGCCSEALRGAMTLTEDIVRNEKQLGIAFDHIFVDAGTGMMAAALILALTQLKRCCTVHVVLIALSDQEFRQVLNDRAQDLEKLMRSPLPSFVPFSTYLPENAASFGATNAKVFQTIHQLAQKEGFLVDPIFSAKLFEEGKSIIAKRNLTGNVLFVHSGGGLSLTGFQDRLKNSLKSAS